MKYPAYSKYKDSSVKGFGEVPEGWEILPLRRLVQVIKTGTTPSGAEDYHFAKDGFNWYSPSDFSDEVSLKKSTRALSEDGKKEVRFFPPMTVMMVGIGATIGKVGLSEKESSCNQQINGIVCNEKLNPIFAAYYLKTIRDFIVKCGKFTTMPIINQDETKNLIVTVPPISEQKTIADFLNQATGKIDTLVAKKRALVGLLKEKRTALISRTVTRGLPAEVAREFGLEPHTRFKDSGHPWLGEIPVGWEINKFSREVKIAEGQVNPEIEPFASMILIAPNHIETGTGRLLAEETSSDQGAISGKYYCNKGEVIYSKIRPELRKVCVAPDTCLCSADMYPMRGIKKVNNLYLFWLFLSDEFSNWAVLESARVAMPKINRETLSELRIPIPPLPEQSAISTYLDGETIKIDNIIEKVESVINRLQEYRTALITAAVTGKIDVREATA